MSQRQDRNWTNYNFLLLFHTDFGKVIILGTVSCSQNSKVGGHLGLVSLGLVY